MDLKDMILVMENYKGTERNMLMTLSASHSGFT